MKAILKRKDYVGLYGNVRIVKGWCRECECHAFVIDHKLACCDSPYKPEPKFLKRESNPVEERRKPTIPMQKKILTKQDHRCFYCNRWSEELQ